MIVNAASRGAFARQFIVQRVASAQDVWQSGTDCFWCGQQFMSSPVDDMPAVAAIEPASAIAPTDGITIGAVERPTMARTESRRNTSVQNFNRSASHNSYARKHISQRKKRRSFRLLTKLSTDSSGSMPNVTKAFHALTSVVLTFVMDIFV